MYILLMVKAAKTDRKSGNSSALIPDKSIHSKDEDQFHQSTLVSQLIKVIDSVQDHLNIGIFGKWGTGKTGILNMLRGELEEELHSKKYDYIYIDAWKLSKDSLRQQLLYELHRKYDPNVSEEEIADQLFHTTVEQVPAGTESWKERIRRLGSETLPYLVIAFVLIVVGFLVDSLWPGRNLLPIISSLFLIPLTVGLMMRLAQASKAVTRSSKRIIPRIESPFQFTQMFDRVMSKRAPGKKTIIALDNLDRCESELVVEILGTLKAFMESAGVIFLVACDDEALVQHLKATKGFENEEYSREFLRKFFQSSITIPPRIEGDILSYVDSLTGKLNVPVPEGVKEVLIAAAIDNPRRIKQFLNNYAMNYLIAQGRESSGLVGTGTLTGKTDFLAKMTVIRDRFPKFYEILSKRDDLLLTIERYFRNEPLRDPDKAEITRIFSDNPDLEWFLQSTRTIEVGDVAPFIKIAQETYESMLPEQEEMKLRVRNNDFQYVRDLLRKADEAKVSNIARMLIGVVDGDMRRKKTTWAFNGLNVILESIEDFPESSSQNLLRCLQRHVSTVEMIGQLPRFSKRKMFPLLHDMPDTYGDPIVTEYCRLVVRSGVADTQILKLIIDNRGLISLRARDRFNESIAGLLSQNEEAGLDLIRNVAGLEELEDRRDGLLTSRTAITITSKLNREDSIEKNRKRVEIYKSLSEVADHATKQAFVKGLLGLLPENPPNTVEEIVQFVLNELNELSDDDVRPTVVGHVFRTMSPYVDSISAEDQKAELLSPLVRHLHKGTSEIKTRFIYDQVQPVLLSGQPETVMKILGAFAESSYSILSHERVIDGLIARGISNLADARLFEFLIEESPKQFKSKVAESLIQNIVSGNPTYWSPALEAFGSGSKHLPQEEVDKVVSTILTTARDVGANDKPLFIKSMAGAYQACSRDIRDSIVDEVLETIQQPEPLSSAGIESFRQIQEQVPIEARRRVLRQLIIRLAGTEVDQMRPTLDLIVDGHDALKQEDALRLIDYLVGHISTAKQEPQQIYAMEYVLRLPNLFRRGRAVLEATLRVSKSTGNQQIIDFGKKIHQTFGKHKVPKKHWKEAREIFGEDVGPK